MLIGLAVLLAIAEVRMLRQRPPGHALPVVLGPGAVLAGVWSYLRCTQLTAGFPCAVEALVGCGADDA